MVIWFYEPNRNDRGMRWNIVSTSHVLATAGSEYLAKQIVGDHNAHAALLAACGAAFNLLHTGRGDPAVVKAQLGAAVEAAESKGA